MKNNKHFNILFIFILGIIFMPNVNVKAIEVGDTLNYDYTGEAKYYKVEKNGLYKLELWGAEGGYRTNQTYSGKGGYSEGTVELKKGDELYIYVGGFGGTGSNGCGKTICPGGFNGGGYRYKYYGGGGATDIRINSDSLYARVIVAGGGGSDGATNKYGMAGGGTSGLSSTERCTALDSYCGKGGTATYSGYSKDYTIATQTTTGLNSNTLANYAGGFGFGGGGTYLSNGYGGAGGGGWYGGAGNIPDGSSDDDRGGGGGSGYVYTEETSANYPAGGLLNSSYYLTEAKTIAGNTSFLSPTGSTENGHTGNGYAKITYLEYTGSTLADIKVDGSTIDEPIEPEVFEYHVAIPEDNYETVIRAIPDGDEIISGDGKVTLRENEVYHLIVINKTGDLNVYNLIPYIKRADLDNISFAEVNFDFKSYKHEYNLKVNNGIKQLTPTISAKEGITYKIEGDLKLKIGNNIIKIIATDGTVSTTYTFNVNREFQVTKNVIEFTGETYEYITPGDGLYTIELWGASGGAGLLSGKFANAGGKGAYVKGTVRLKGGTSIFINVGGEGKMGVVGKVVPGGYNGGGQGDHDHDDDEAGGSGGGATDIRLVGGAWNDFESLKSRIMVAGGGGGGVDASEGGYGGALTGGSTPHNDGGTQTTGYAFGQGQNGVNNGTNNDFGGGGSGYYGGFAKYKSGGASYKIAGGGGSSYVSGCTGCNAISKDSTSTNIVHTGQPNHYSGYVFQDIVMIAGNASMPTHDGTGTMIGNSGNGYVKITPDLDSTETEEKPIITSLSTDKGEWDQPFNKDIHEYTIELDPLDTIVNIIGTTNNYDAKLSGIGELSIEPGTLNHEVILTDKNGNMQKYTLHFTREINSYKYLDDILINGVSIPDFAPNKFVYDVVVPFNFDMVHITGITHNQFQEVLNDGVFIMENDTLSQTIVAVPESKEPNQYYTINISREKSSKLKQLTIKNLGVDNIKFNNIDMDYELEIFDSLLSLDVEPVPYYKSASITVTGDKFLEDKITITSHVDGVEDSVYNIKIKRTKEVVYETNYSCTGAPEEFIAPYSGYYKISLWGAAGGGGQDDGRIYYLGGEGAYTSGTILLKQGDALYFNVGCKGKDGGDPIKDLGGAGGYNGGGKGGDDPGDSYPESGGGGGGATDVRILNGAWNTVASLRSRIMVAAGGAGGAEYSKGAPGGGLLGYKPYTNNSLATQVGGYSYGIGANGLDGSSTGSGGAGGGYYGGYTASNGYGSGSGSSYISGHAGSIGTTELGTPNKSTYTAVEDSYNYSGKFFTNTSMIDGSGYLWTTAKNQLDLMPNPKGGYFPSGKGNADDGFASIKILQALSSNNYLDSLEIKVGDKVLDFTPDFATWIQDYELNLDNTESTIEINAIPKDKLATITGAGIQNVKPGNSVLTISVTSTDGSIRNYNLNVYREPSNDPTPNNIKIKGMTPYICNEIDSSYCLYEFDSAIENYEITVPFAITKLELTPVLKSAYQEVNYYIYDGTNYEIYDNVDDEGNKNASLKVDLNNGLNQYIIEIVAENGEDSTLYYYDITRDPTGNTNVSNIRIVDPNIEYPFAPLIYEYYITLDEDMNNTEVLFEVDKELEESQVSITGNNNLTQGMNDCYITITAPNGETKTYIYHIYKSASSNVYLQKLEIKDGEQIYSLTPSFDKVINDYLINITNSNNLEIIAEPEDSNATVNISKPNTFASGINQVTIKVTNGDASNTYYLNIIKNKSSNASLSNLEIFEYNGVTKYDLNQEFDKDNLDYTITIPKTVRKVKVTATPAEASTKCTVKGNTSLINNVSNITITCTAEDNTVKVYTVSALKDVSDNNKLKDIEISTGEGIGNLIPNFEENIYDYRVEVSDSIDKINIKGILSDSSAKVSGNGFYSLVKGDNIIELVVRSERGTEQIYTVNVHKNLNDDNSLKEIKNSQNNAVSHPSENIYTINVQYEVKSITIEGIANNPNATVSGNGAFNLNVGDNPINLMVTSESGSVANYTVNVVRDLSNNDDLAYLYAEEGALNPIFKDTTIFYDVYVGPNVEKLTLSYESEDKNAKVEVTGNENFVVGENQVVLTVTAQSGKKKSYTLNVYRQDTTDEVIDELLLSSLKVNNELISGFNETIYKYEMTVPNSTSSIAIDGTAKNANHLVSGSGTYDLRVGKNALHLAVSNQDGIRKDYQVIITREKSDDATLSALVVKGHVLNPSFSKDNNKYSLTTSNETLEFTTITPTEKDATYEIINNEGFTTANPTEVIIRVTSPSKNVTKDYTITVTKTPSNNNNLIKLEAIGYNLVPEFHKGITTYTLVVESDVNNLIIDARPEDQNATVTGSGLHELVVGTNNITIKVESEAGTSKNYNIIVTKKGNDNNYLQELYVSEGEVNPTFDRETLNYKLVVPNTVTDLSVFGTPEVNTSTITGLGTYPLNVGINNIKIVVTSEVKTERTYNLEVTREELITAKLANLSVKNYDLDSEFNSDFYEYYINVPNEITSLNAKDINAVPIDPNGTKVEILGDLDNLKLGMNKLTIKVTSLKNPDIEENYNLYVNRQLSSNNKLLSLSVSEGTLNPIFNPDILSYNVTVSNNVTNITVDASGDSNVIINDIGPEFSRNYNLVTGENKISIKVKSLMGIERVYSIIVNREVSSNNYLSSLEVKSNDELLNFAPIFSREETNYTLNVDSSIDFIQISADSEDQNATISGLGTKELTKDINIFEIVVTSESGDIKTYTLTVNKVLSNNVKVLDIIPSVGTLTPVFNSDTKIYDLTVTENDLFLEFEVKLEDNHTTVKGNESLVIPSGRSTRIIEITAEDGTKDEYTINVIKENTAEARLESLELEHYPFEFEPNTFTYNIKVSNTKDKILASELKAIPKDSEATVNLMGDMELIDGIVNIYVIEVIAKDGYTTEEYTLNITRDSDEYTLRTNKYEIVRNETEDYVIGIEPSTVIQDFKNNFENEPEYLKVYEETTLVDESGLTATAYILKLERNDYVYDTLRIIVRGDLTKDGKVNITDQVKMINYVGRTTTFDRYQMLAGDLTFDGKVNITDQVKIINYVGRTISDLNNKPTS